MVCDWNVQVSVFNEIHSKTAFLHSLEEFFEFDYVFHIWNSSEKILENTILAINTDFIPYYSIYPSTLQDP